MSRTFQAAWPKGPPRVILLSAAAGALPGLVPALQAFMDARETAVQEEQSSAEEDFGENLLDEDACGAGPVVVLSPDAAARGAHAAAPHFERGDVPRRHLESVAPLPLPQPPEAGPARLQFQGQDYLLRERSFFLGRHPDCDLVFDRALYPNVSPHHCEIIYDPAAFMLRDCSREGTWVNDQPVTQPVMLRPGDWIRLGPDGPLLHFLGQAQSSWQLAVGS